MSETALTDSTEPKRLALLQLRAGLGQFDVHDVAQFLLRVIRDADGADATFEPHPLVFFRVPEFFGICAHFARL